MKDHEVIEETPDEIEKKPVRVVIKHNTTLIEISCSDLTAQECVNMGMQCISFLQKTPAAETEPERNDDLDGQKEYEKLMRSL